MTKKRLVDYVEYGCLGVVTENHVISAVKLALAGKCDRELAYEYAERCNEITDKEAY